MKQNNGGLLVGGLLLGGVVLAMVNKGKHEGIQAYKNLDLIINGLHTEGNDIILSVTLLNPNTEKMEVKSFVGNMYIDAYHAAKINMFGDYIAQGSSKVTIPLVCIPNEQRLFDIVRKKIATGGAPGYTITYKGTINVNNTAIPITMKYRTR
jgi:LEA14-like dessication related protein